MTMKAAVYTRYGSPEVLEIRQVPMPEPAEGQVRIRVHATTVTRTDCGKLRGHPFPMRFLLGLGGLRPKRTILGVEFAGEVEALAPDVTALRPGQRVFGIAPRGFGAQAEYLCLSEKGNLAAIPEDVSFGETVVCEGALYADNFLQAFDLGPAHRILIYGASGAIGTAAVQLAVARGAEVTAVVPTKHMDLARSLGAQHVVDYTAEDFTRLGQTFDFVLDAVGKTSYFRCRRLLKPTGVFAASDMGPWGSNVLLTAWSAITKTGRVIFPFTNQRKAFVPFLKSLIEVRQFRAVIDRAYPLEAIADAYRYVETGQKVGIVVIHVVAPEGKPG